MSILNEMLEMAGVSDADLPESNGSSEELAEAMSRVKHTHDPGRQNLVVTHPQDVFRAVLSPLGASPMPMAGYSASAPVDSPNAIQIRAALEERGYKNHYPVLVLYALSPATNKESRIASFEFGNKVLYSDLGGRHSAWTVEGDPSFEHVGKAEAAINVVVSKASKFIKNYVKAAQKVPKSPVGGESIDRALQINKELGLRIPEAKLKKLFHVLGK